jgi:ankyrin repeat protein
VVYFLVDGRAQGLGPAEIEGGIQMRGKVIPGAVAALMIWVWFGASPAQARPAIFNAVQKGDVARVKAMLRKDPKLIKVRFGEGRFTPLHWAARYGRVKVAALLIAKGADLSAKTGEGEGWTPLHYAAAEGGPGVVRLLLDKGAKVGARGTEGQTPLHAAAGAGNPQVIHLLLAKGADRAARDRKGRTPQDIARAKNHIAAVQMLQVPAGGRSGGGSPSPATGK